MATVLGGQNPSDRPHPHRVVNPAIVVADDAQSATGRWYLLQAATLRQPSRAVWIAGRYEDERVRISGEWRFHSVTIRTRFFTPYASGWAETPLLDAR